MKVRLVPGARRDQASMSSNQLLNARKRSAMVRETLPGSRVGRPRKAALVSEAFQSMSRTCEKRWSPAKTPRCADLADFLHQPTPTILIPSSTTNHAPYSRLIKAARRPLLGFQNAVLLPIPMGLAYSFLPPLSTPHPSLQDRLSSKSSAETRPPVANSAAFPAHLISSTSCSLFARVQLLGGCRPSMAAPLPREHGTLLAHCLTPSEYTSGREPTPRWRFWMAEFPEFACLPAVTNSLVPGSSFAVLTPENPLT